jgi:hypothetical protein
MCQLALGHYFIHDENDPVDIWLDSDVFVETLARFQMRYGFDGYLINLPGRPPNWPDYVAKRRDENGRRVVTWKNGTVSIFPSDDNPHASLADGDALARADYRAVDPDDPATYRLNGYVWNTWHAPTLFDIPGDADLTDPAAYPDWLTRGLRTARRISPDVSVHAEVFSPFTHLLELFGYDQALMALLDASDTCHRLLDRFAAMVSAQVQRIGACEPDAILISSAFAGAGFISPIMYDEFVLPYERRTVEAIHRFSVPAYTHTCGAIGDRLELMSATGTDGIDTLDPPPLGTVDLAEAKKHYGDRLFLKGNLDAVNEMLYADDERFEAAVRERLTIGKPGSGYILSSACSVAPHVSPQRAARLAELADQHGRYDSRQADRRDISF